MARKRMVTRTVKFESVTAMTVNLEDRTTGEITCQITGKFKTNEDLLKLVKKSVDTDDLKVVSIISHESVEQLMGMTEEEFIDLARYIEKPVQNTEQSIEDIEE